MDILILVYQYRIHKNGLLNINVDEQVKYEFFTEGNIHT